MRSWLTCGVTDQNKAMCLIFSFFYYTSPNWPVGGSCQNNTIPPTEVMTPSITGSLRIQPCCTQQEPPYLCVNVYGKRESERDRNRETISSCLHKYTQVLLVSRYSPDEPYVWTTYLQRHWYPENTLKKKKYYPWGSILAGANVNYPICEWWEESMHFTPFEWVCWSRFSLHWVAP